MSAGSTFTSRSRGPTRERNAGDGRTIETTLAEVDGFVSVGRHGVLAIAISRDAEVSDDAIAFGDVPIPAAVARLLELDIVVRPALLQPVTRT
jgi:hypothetical protein